MMTTPGLMRRSPLAAFHRSVWARMDKSFGWEVAIDCGDRASEDEALRSGSILVDWSHLGKIEVRGRGALDQVGALEPKAKQLEPLNMMMRPDLAVLRLAEDEFVLLTPAESEHQILGHIKDDDCVVIDLTGAAGALLLAGPTRFEVLERSAAMDLSPEGLGVGRTIQTSVHMARNTILRAPTYDLYIQQRDLTEYVHGAFLDVGRKVGLVPAGLGTFPVDWS